MELGSYETMEKSNILYGFSRGTYLVEPRRQYQDAFVEFLHSIDADDYGYMNSSTDHLSEEGRTFENDVFTLRAYYLGEDRTLGELPNFVYKPTNLIISWYKYPMRDSYSNQDISLEDFRTILNKCKESITNNAK